MVTICRIFLIWIIMSVYLAGQYNSKYVCGLFYKQSYYAIKLQEIKSSRRSIIAYFYFSEGNVY